MHRVLTIANRSYILENYTTVSQTDMAKEIGRAKGTVASFMRAQGLQTPKAVTTAARVRKMRGRTSSTPQIDALLTECYLTEPKSVLAKRTGRSETFVVTRLRQLGLAIPMEIIDQRKRDSRIKPGNTPPNKGRKQIEYMSAEQIAKTAGTRFKKGQKSHTELYDGAIRIRHSSQARGDTQHYVIRLAKGKWKELQIHNWEKVNGPVPKGHILACKDGNTLNCEPDNWYLMTKADNARRNSGHETLPDSRVAGYLAGKRLKEFKKDFLEHPELLEVKRQQLLLRRSINDKKRKVRE